MLNSHTKAAAIRVEPFWSGLFAKALAKANTRFHLQCRG